MDVPEKCLATRLTRGGADLVEFEDRNASARVGAAFRLFPCVQRGEVALAPGFAVTKRFLRRTSWIAGFPLGDRANQCLIRGS